jgi:hypothetical protein
MLKKIVAGVAVVFASACIDDGIKGSPGSLPTEETPEQTANDTPLDEPTTMAEESAARQTRHDPEDPAVCSMLPHDDSACAHACDEDALLAYIPEGTCASFSCPLTDGTTFVTGGCN